MYLFIYSLSHVFFCSTIATRFRNRPPTTNETSLRRTQETVFSHASETVSSVERGTKLELFTKLDKAIQLLIIDE